MKRSGLTFCLSHVLFWISLVLTVKLNTKYYTIFQGANPTSSKKHAQSSPVRTYLSFSYTSIITLVIMYRKAPTVCCCLQTLSHVLFYSSHVFCTTTLGRHYCQHTTGKEVTAQRGKWFSGLATLFSLNMNS